MELDLYQVDAFADRPFEGNPAAVVPLTEWPDDAVLTAIAAENNLSETAFFVRNADGLVLRWFTPAIEVALCGHATLATAHVLFTELTRDVDQIRFETRHSGPLIVRREGTGYTLDFPAQPLAETPVDPALVDALGVERRRFSAVRRAPNGWSSSKTRRPCEASSPTSPPSDGFPAWGSS